MAISVDWATKVVSVPKADLTLIQSSPTEIRQLNLEDFHLWLRGAEASEDGNPFDIIHNYNLEVLLGGITYAAVMEIINGRTSKPQQILLSTSLMIRESCGYHRH